MTVRCHIALSGQAEPPLAVVERMRAELAATVAAAGRSDLTCPSEAEPASAGCQ
jgi:hypothetical protein